MKKIIVTGSSGFIGACIARRLLELGYYVIGIDEMPGIIEQDNYTNIQTDICDFGGSKAFRNLYGICHQAAYGSVPKSIENPETWVLNNIEVMTRMLEIARRGNTKKFVWASSSSIYGELGQPLSPYAASKQSCESIAHAYSRNYDMNVIGLRYFNVFGATQPHETGGIIAKIDHKIRYDLPIEIYGNGSVMRDYTYIDNVVEANIKALELDWSTLPSWSERMNGKAVDIGCGHSTSIINLIELFQEIYDKEIKVVFKDARQGDIKDSRANINDAKALFDYEISHDLRRGLTEMIRKNNGSVPCEMC